jgi:5-hydroxyisourate hydrolase
MTSLLTTHVLDTARGAPAAGIRVVLDRETAPAAWTRLAEGKTDADGRCRTLLPAGATLVPGAHRLVFDLAPYFAAQGTASFWREVTVEFLVRDASAHHHVPLLVSPFGYSTYRGS